MKKLTLTPQQETWIKEFLLDHPKQSPVKLPKKKIMERVKAGLKSGDLPEGFTQTQLITWSMKEQLPITQEAVDALQEGGEPQDPEKLLNTPPNIDWIEDNFSFLFEISPKDVLNHFYDLHEKKKCPRIKYPWEAVEYGLLQGWELTAEGLKQARTNRINIAELQPAKKRLQSQSLNLAQKVGATRWEELAIRLKGDTVEYGRMDESGFKSIKSEKIFPQLNSKEYDLFIEIAQADGKYIDERGGSLDCRLYHVNQKLKHAFGLEENPFSRAGNAFLSRIGKFWFHRA